MRRNLLTNCSILMGKKENKEKYGDENMFLEGGKEEEEEEIK